MKPLLRWGRLASVVLAGVLLYGCGGGGSDAGTQRASNDGRVRALAVQATPATDIKVIGLTKLLEARATRVLFDYTFKVTVRNTGSTAYENVVLTLTSAGAGTTVIDGVVTLGSIAAGGELSPSDTITLRQDRTKPFDSSALTWRIEGTAITSSPQVQLAALEASGVIPTLERGTTLKGVDSNANGIRDDIDAYINAQFKDAGQRAAAIQMARALQATLLVSPENVESAKAADLRVSFAVNCVFTRFPAGPVVKQAPRVVQELESLTSNTKTRLLAYLAYNNALNGTVSDLPEGDTCE